MQIMHPQRSSSARISQANRSNS